MTTTATLDRSALSDLAIAADEALSDAERQTAIDRLVDGPLRHPIPYVRWRAHRDAINERSASLMAQTG